MKIKSIIIIVLIAFLMGCDSSEKTTVVVAPKKVAPQKIYKYGLRLYEVDSCEYLGSIFSTSSDYITHKGNCIYCHKRDSLMMVSILKEILKK